jgi:hypothetical protein
MLERRIEIIKTLRATPIVLRALVDRVDEAGLRRRPGPGEWAIIEVVAHLADTEERALGRVRQMLAEDMPTWSRSTRKPWPSSATTWSWTWRLSWPAWSSSVASTWSCWTPLMQ